jgi:hypothetical protein
MRLVELIDEENTFLVRNSGGEQSRSIWLMKLVNLMELGSW